MAVVELAYETWGSSSNLPLVLVHGAGSRGSIWEPIARTLSDRYCLIAPDLRGHGASPRPGSYAPEEFLADLEAFVDARGLESFTLIVHSLLGLVGVGYAIRHPRRVRALVSIDANIPPPQWQIDYLRSAGGKPHPIFASRADGIAHLRTAISSVADERMLDTAAGSLLVECDGRFTLGYDRRVLEQFAVLDVATEIERLRCPTLFLRGSESSIMDRSAGIAMLHRVARAHLVQIPRSSHYIFLDNPAATAHELRLFLAEALGAG